MVASISWPPLAELNILSIPFKQTKDVDWISQLNSSIKKLGEDPSTWQDEILRFHRMRQDIRGAPPTAVGTEIVAAYYTQLESLLRRISINEHPLEVKFVWFDAFESCTCATQNSVAFEKANVLFNLGALYSQLEGDNTGKGFQLAASTFSFIAENFLHPPLTDISRPSLLFLSDLMLAQAQERISIKAIHDSKSLKVISRLSLSAMNLYGQAQSRFSSNDLSEFRIHFFDPRKRCESIFEYLEGKVCLWDILYHFSLSQAAVNEAKVGEAIARYRYIKERVSSHEGQNAPFQEAFKFLSEHISKTLPGLEKDNNLVYSHVIPTMESLTKLEAATMATRLGFTEFMSTNRPDIFKNLFPLHVHQELSKYSEEKSKLLRYETLKITQADSELQSTLSSLGFPNVIDSLKRFLNGDGVSMTDFHEESLDEELISSMSTKISDLSILIQRSEEILDKDIRDYQIFHVEYGDGFKQNPPHLENGRLFQQLAMVQTRYQELQTRQKHVLSLSNDRGVLFKAAVGSGHAPDPTSKEHNLSLEKILLQLSSFDATIVERSRLLNSLKDALLDDDVGDLYSCGKVDTPEANFAKELAKFDMFCQPIEDNISAQSELLRRFKEDWIRLLNTSGYSKFEAAIAESKLCLKELNESHMRTNKNISLMREAVSMYDAIMVFAKARETERRNAADSHYSEQCRNGQKFLLERLKQMSVKSQNNGAYSANKDPVIPKNDDNKGSGDIQNFNSSLLD